MANEAFIFMANDKCELWSKNGIGNFTQKIAFLDGLRLINRDLWEQDIRQKLPLGVKRDEWKDDHGYRKYFKSHAEQVMRLAYMWKY